MSTMAVTRPPNILWLCTDQQRWDTIGAAGCQVAQTPNLDDLWQNSWAFTHAFCQSPICTPSRASFLTGVYPSTTQNTRNGNLRWSGRYPLVTRTLADAGYDCGLVGKLHLASAYERLEPRGDDGYSFYKWSHAPRDDWPEGHAYADWVRAQGADLAELIEDPAGVPAPLHQTTWCAEESIDFIREHGRSDAPWLLSVNIYDPHPPFNPPAEYRSRFSPDEMPHPAYRDSDLAQQRTLSEIEFQGEARGPEALDIANPVLPDTPDAHAERENANTRRDAPSLIAAYHAMIAQIDEQVGRILAALEESDQQEDTLVIFTSDHGEMLGDHGLIQKGCRFYEGLVRVPLILRWPSRLHEPRESDDLVELTDLPPTLLEAAGLDVPSWIVGQSLLSGATQRDAVRCEYFDALDSSLGDGRATAATMYRTRTHKLVSYHGHQVGELYDLERDPNEHSNRWDDPDYRSLQLELTEASFDLSIHAAVDVGTERIGPY